MKQLLLELNPPVAPSLVNFVPGSNLELLQLLQKIICAQEAERFVYIWGGGGSGKSHLLQAVIDFFIQRQQRAVYLPCDQFDQFQISDGIKCIAIDDVEQLSDAGQVKLFNLYNELRDIGNIYLLVTGFIAPSQLNLRQDLVTRLGWGLVYQVHELSENEKKEALFKHASERGFDLRPEIVQYLLRHNRRDLSSLIMTLDALDRFSLVHKRQITVPLLKKLLQES